MARVIKLKESDITNIVRKIIKEKYSTKGMHTQFPEFPLPGEGGDPWTWNTGGGGDTYGGNKGDMSKTRPGKRDYEGKAVEITSNSMREALGNPRNMDEVLRGYTKLYNANEKVKGIPTPQEMEGRMMEIEETNPNPSPAMFWILIVGTLVALGIRWANGYGAPWQWDSDITLKENIDLVGKSESGINIYEFDYINKKYGNGRYRGVMAQEVPSASFVGPEGTLMVDYSKIDVKFEELN